jgi:hypothetical protein
LQPTDTPPPIDKLFQTYIDYHGTPGYHHGIDIHKPGGTSVLSSTDGIVDFAGYYYPISTSYTYSIMIKAPDGNFWDYRHVAPDSIPLKPGDRVKAGEEIARIYDTSEDPTIENIPSHLHLEIRDKEGNYLNPLDFLIESDDSTAPFINDIFFCPKGSNKVISKRKKGRIVLSGKVDAIVEAYDTIPPGKNIHPIQKIEYSVHDEKKEVVPNTILWNFSRLPERDDYLNKVTDIYKRKMILRDRITRRTETDQTYYFIVTNNKNGAIDDKEGYLDTTLLPNGSYTFRVRAYDYKGNRSKKSVSVFINNPD